ncbi:hypothetical protein FGO68_gene3544 [Halteria grandinella]|uniref:Uncharacterized protein n=1 Tax=Halteria grandinella TaxID=5974 RepID=A0A8J8NZM4_HALGN|nr:hypothetical protein FGO68_gene3544 [Halteria grandinella]
MTLSKTIQLCQQIIVYRRAFGLAIPKFGNAQFNRRKLMSVFNLRNRMEQLQVILFNFLRIQNLPNASLRHAQIHYQQSSHYSNSIFSI